MNNFSLNYADLNHLPRDKAYETFSQNFETEYIRKIKELKKADEAFLNSILSFAVYEQNLWMIKDIEKDLSEMGSMFVNTMENKDKMYELKVWNFLKNNFKTISNNEINMNANGMMKSTYGYESDNHFENGQYSASNGIAHACVLKSKDPKGNGEILHLSFRGTEFSRLKEYITGPYLDMSAYYENFIPLIENIRDYINNSDNNITEIHVSGHSLGGAMVQEFLKNNPPNSFSVPIKGFTFGSPGSEKKWYHKFATLTFHSIGRGIPLIDLLISTNIKSNNDVRMTQYYHKNDPIPLIGLLGYTKGGNNHALNDIAYKDDKDAKLEKELFLEKIPAFGKLITGFKENILNKFNTKFHDSKRYIINLRNYIEKNYDEPLFKNNSTDLIRNTPNWKNWRKCEKDFSNLSIKYKSAFEYLLKEQNPEINNETIIKRVLELRELMRNDSKSNVILSRTKNNNNHAENKLKTHIRNKDFEFTPSLGITTKYLAREQLIANTDSSMERIKKMRASYIEKMKAREGIFKKD